MCNITRECTLNTCTVQRRPMSYCYGLMVYISIATANVLNATQYLSKPSSWSVTRRVLLIGTNTITMGEVAWIGWQGPPVLVVLGKPSVSDIIGNIISRQLLPKSSGIGRCYISSRQRSRPPQRWIHHPWRTRGRPSISVVMWG